jgi:hypothetical protein
MHEATWAVWTTRKKINNKENHYFLYIKLASVCGNKCKLCSKGTQAYCHQLNILGLCVCVATV